MLGGKVAWGLFGKLYMATFSVGPWAQVATLAVSWVSGQGLTLGGMFSLMGGTDLWYGPLQGCVSTASVYPEGRSPICSADQLL